MRRTLLIHDDYDRAGDDKSAANNRRPTQCLAEKQRAEQDGEGDAELVDGGHFGYRPELQGKSQDKPVAPPDNTRNSQLLMAIVAGATHSLRQETMSAIITRMTAVRMNVARFELMSATAED